MIEHGVIEGLSREAICVGNQKLLGDAQQPILGTVLEQRLCLVFDQTVVVRQGRVLAGTFPHAELRGAVLWTHKGRSRRPLV